MLGAATVPAVMGWDLSRRGLAGTAEAADTVEQAAAQAQAAAKDATRLVGASGSHVAALTGSDAAAIAAANQDVAEKAAAVTDALGSVNTALEALTGRFAPARVAFSLALLLVTAALFAFDVISLSVG